MAVSAALLSLAIGLGPLVTSRPGLFLVAGVALSLDYWVFGQAFGQMFTGLGTDPGTAPLVILLALTILPVRQRVPEVATVVVEPACLRIEDIFERAGMTR